MYRIKILWSMNGNQLAGLITKSVINNTISAHMNLKYKITSSEKEEGITP